jgi:demethylspheroidene O-methyltransferase
MTADYASQAWLDGLVDFGDRLVADSRFRRWAARFPLTRPLVRRRARALFDLCAGFVYSQVLQACVELRVFAILAEGPATTDVLAQRLALPPASAARLLRAAEALDLVELRRGRRYGLGTLGAALAGDEGLVAMIAHQRELYADLSDPVALLRGTRDATAVAAFWPYGAGDPAALSAAAVARYTRLMAATQSLVALQVLDAYDLRRHRCLLDVGGGDGTFLVLAAHRAPALRLVLFDLPAVVARGESRLAAAGLAGRATAIGGDFHADPLPPGADLICLLRVLHDHDDDQVRALLRSARRVLPAGGRLLVAEPMAGVPGARRVGDAYFGFFLMAMGRGRARTPDELTAYLRDAGFRQVRRIATQLPLQTGLLVAQA